MMQQRIKMVERVNMKLTFAKLSAKNNNKKREVRRDIILLTKYKDEIL